MKRALVIFAVLFVPRLGVPEEVPPDNWISFAVAVAEVGAALELCPEGSPHSTAVMLARGAHDARRIVDRALQWDEATLTSSQLSTLALLRRSLSSWLDSLGTVLVECCPQCRGLGEDDIRTMVRELTRLLARHPTMFFDDGPWYHQRGPRSWGPFVERRSSPRPEVPDCGAPNCLLGVP